MYLKYLTSCFLFFVFHLDSILAHPSKSPLRPHVIYDSDQRKEIFNESPQNSMLFIKDRILAVVHSAKLVSKPDGSVGFLDSHYGRALKLCSNELFYTQPTFARCTASIVGTNKVLTAGHCISENGCAMTRFISQYIMRSSSETESGLTPPINTTQDHVFSCKKILFRDKTFYTDIALIEVDRDFNITPLIISSNSNELKPNIDEITAIGFPGGLPMKSSGYGPIISTKNQIITAEIDTYGGNSGSPVFTKNSTDIQGILVRGEDDYTFNNEKKCYESKICSSVLKNCQGEEIIP
ncbi:MAG: trypsin-like serine peptidase, partial [Pseudobdellovibrio sp.]